MAIQQRGTDLRLRRLRWQTIERRNTLAATSARLASSFSRMAELFEGGDPERVQRYRDQAAHFTLAAIRWSWPTELGTDGVDPDGIPAGGRGPGIETPLVEGGPGADRLAALEDGLDPQAAEVARGAALGRALVTARGADRLDTYLALLDEVRTELGSAPSPPVDFFLGCVGSLALVAAILARSAERSGLVTESGLSLLADLFQRLASEGVTI